VDIQSLVGEGEGVRLEDMRTPEVEEPAVPVPTFNQSLLRGGSVDLGGYTMVSCGLQDRSVVSRAGDHASDRVTPLKQEFNQFEPDDSAGEYEDFSNHGERTPFIRLCDEPTVIAREADLVEARLPAVEVRGGPGRDDPSLIRSRCASVRQASTTLRGSSGPPYARRGSYHRWYENPGPRGRAPR
jgi:hypothetical protein